jgi:hypothetical protein
MTWRNRTRIFILAVLAVTLIYDLAAAIFGGTGTTISHEIIVFSYDYPIMPFTVGVVMGHLFWRMPSTDETEKRDRRT